MKGKVIYMEQTIDLVIEQMAFKTDKQLDTFLEGFDEKITPSGITYFIKK